MRKQQPPEERSLERSFSAAYSPDIDTFSVLRDLRAARESMGLSPFQLSERTGVPSRDISLLERGKGNPSIKLLQILAHGMGMGLRIEFYKKE